MHDAKINVKWYLLCGIFYVNLQFNKKNIVPNNPKPVPNGTPKTYRTASAVLRRKHSFVVA